MEAWRQGIPERNARIAERAQRAQGSKLAQDCWGKTLEEVAAGWVSQPSSITAHDLASIALTPRFAINDSHGGRPTKIRLIDDFRASGVNDIVTMADTEIPQDLDVFLANVAFYQRVDPSCQIEAFSLDYAHAYKNAPLCRDQQQFATIVITPPRKGHRRQPGFVPSRSAPREPPPIGRG